MNVAEENLNKASSRIESRQKEIEIEVDKLDNDIIRFTKYAWRCIWLGVFITIFALFYFSIKIETPLNEMGDFMSGTVASIWSLAGLFFIYVAFIGQKVQILHQQMEIMHSQLELKYTRFELEGQKKEMIEQNNTLKIQRFENTFFSMLSLHHRIVENVDLTYYPNGRGLKGRDAFRFIFETLTMLMSQNVDKDFKIIYLEEYEQLRTHLGHYFRNIYRIIKLVDNLEIKTTNRKKKSDKDNYQLRYSYTSILRAQLSDFEILLLFYNCLTSNGSKRLKPFIEKYSLLNNITSDLLHDQQLMKLYEPNAYGSKNSNEASA